jgi:starch phosphorylase
MKPIRTFDVSPSLPTKIEPLRKLAYNLYWDWNTEIKSLFERLDPDLWQETHQNPVLLLGKIHQERLLEVAEDEGFLAHMDRAVNQLNNYLASRQWYKKNRSNIQQKECYA